MIAENPRQKAENPRPNATLNPHYPPAGHSARTPYTGFAARSLERRQHPDSGQAAPEATARWDAWICAVAHSARCSIDSNTLNLDIGVTQQSVGVKGVLWPRCPSQPDQLGIWASSARSVPFWASMCLPELPWASLDPLGLTRLPGLSWASLSLSAPLLGNQFRGAPHPLLLSRAFINVVGPIAGFSESLFLGPSPTPPGRRSH